MYTPAPSPQKTVLSYASRKMAEAHEETGRYPSNWHDLMDGAGFNGETIVREAHREQDAPKPSDGPRWSPKYVFHELRITNADQRTFAIHAVDARGRTTWEITNEDRRPRQLLPMICHLESICMEYSNSEAASFLDYARMRILLMPLRPRTWGQSLLHWSMLDHYENDLDAIPLAGTRDRWTPPGSKFTYHFESEHDYYMLWSSNNYGLENYVVDGLRAEPVKYKP